MSTNPTTSVQILSDFLELEKISGDWERLWDLSPRRESFTRFQWARAWWRVYGGNLRLCVVVVRREGAVVGILPLVAQGSTLRFLGAPHSDYNDILCSSEDATQVLEDALTGLSRAGIAWSRCELDELAEYSTLRLGLPNISRSLRRKLLVTSGNACPTLLLDQDKEQILHTILHKQSLRRHQKKLAALGKVTFRHIDDLQEIKSHLPIFYKFHARRRALAGDGRHTNQDLAFLNALADEFSSSPSLRFGILEVAGRPVAYHLGFELDGKFVFYKPAFDVNFWDYGAGEVLIAELFQYAKKSDIREFDFTRGGEAYKSRFSNLVRTNTNVRFYSNRIAARLIQGVESSSVKARTLPLVVRWKPLGQRAYFSVQKSLRKVRRKSVPAILYLAIRAGMRTFWARDEVLVFSSRLNTAERQCSCLELWRSVHPAG